MRCGSLFISSFMVFAASASHLRVQEGRWLQGTGTSPATGVVKNVTAGECTSPVSLSADLKSIPECKSAAKQFENWFRGMDVPSATAIKAWATKMCSPTCEEPYTQAIAHINAVAVQCHAQGHGSKLLSLFEIKPTNAQQQEEDDQRRPQSFFETYPAFPLACLKDPADDQYCATKTNGGPNRSCEYLSSCCFGEVTRRSREPFTAQDAVEVEKLCPGAAAASNMTCSAAATR